MDAVVKKRVGKKKILAASHTALTPRWHIAYNERRGRNARVPTSSAAKDNTRRRQNFNANWSEAI